VKRLLIFCLLAFALAYGQQKQRLAVLPSVGELDAQKLDLLTNKVREVAAKMLPQNSFILLRQDAVVEAIGAEDYFIACKEGTCIGELAKKANANYGARCDVFSVDNNLVLKFELYSVKDEAILETFTDYEAKDFYRMLVVLEERLPGAFKKMIPVGSKSSPLIPGGISSVESVRGNYEVNYEKSYLVNISTEPAGAILSFNGVPVASCTKTPCRAELPEGSIRIVAAMEQYETADTTVLIRQNNQSIAITLKSNFGVLEIRPAYYNGIGGNKGWSLTINEKGQYSYENRLSPGYYDVKLGHECYEDIVFKAGINKGSREVFDMARYLYLKTGGLVLSAERDGYPVIEPVFVNGWQVGETPFSGTVPICAEISIGKNKDKVDVKIAYGQTIKYNHRIHSDISAGILTDSRDGKRYKVAWIGSQLWMAENLNFNAKGSKCYNNNESNCQKYGRLYNWDTAMNACPIGWHLPTNKEWDQLYRYVDNASGTESPYESKTAGKLLKATNGWSKDRNGEDKYGFSALPGGKYSHEIDNKFIYSGWAGYWWSSSKYNSFKSYGRYMQGDNDYASWDNFDAWEEQLFSVRCLQGNQQYEIETTYEKKTKPIWGLIFPIGISIDGSLKFWNTSIEFHPQDLEFFSFGLNADVLSKNTRINAFTNLHFWTLFFLSGGVGWDFHTSTPIFPLGGGFDIDYSGSGSGIGLVLGALYNLRPSSCASPSLRAGMKFKWKS